MTLQGRSDLARRTALIVACLAFGPLSAKGGAIYSVKDLGVVYTDAIGDDDQGGPISVDDSGKVGHGYPMAAGGYTLRVQTVSGFVSSFVKYGDGPDVQVQIAAPNQLATAVATAVNAQGEVVGYTADQGPQRAFIFQANDPQNGATLIPLLSGFFNTGGTTHLNSPYYNLANGINSQGTIVGLDSDGDLRDSHAFIYQEGIATDLNSLIPLHTGLVLTNAASINDSGEIAGYATDAAGKVHEVLLLPATAPEPATWLITSTGLVAAMIWRRRRGDVREAKFQANSGG